MDNEKKQSNEQNAAESWWGTACCGPQDESGGFWNCCGGAGGARDCRSMMERCWRVCRWIPLLPVVLGISLLLLGYYLDASITRVLWMLAAGFSVVLGILGLILAGTMKNMCCGTGRENQML